MVTANTAVLHSNSYDDLKELEDEIRDALGDIDHIEVFGQQILAAVYAQPLTYRKSGLILPNSMNKEDKWQSKCVLMLKAGGEAFHNLTKKQVDERFNGRIPQAGDWLYHNVKIGEAMNLCGSGSKMRKPPNVVSARDWTGWPVRILFSTDIDGRTKRPQDII